MNHFSPGFKSSSSDILLDYLEAKSVGKFKMNNNDKLMDIQEEIKEEIKEDVFASNVIDSVSDDGFNSK